jgi:flagellar protein FliO/FliZ
MKGSWRLLLPAVVLPGVLAAAEPGTPTTVSPLPPASQESGIQLAPTPPPVTGALSPDNASVPPTAGSRTLVEKLRDQGERKRDSSPSVLNMLGGLAMTLGLLFALAWVARRLRLNVPGMAQGMRLEGAVALGPREKLCVVTRGDKVYVLGVTQQSITLIDSEPASPEQEPVPDTQFSDRIKKLLQNGAPHGS